MGYGVEARHADAASKLRLDNPLKPASTVGSEAAAVDDTPKATVGSTTATVVTCDADAAGNAGRVAWKAPPAVKEESCQHPHYHNTNAKDGEGSVWSADADASRRSAAARGGNAAERSAAARSRKAAARRRRK